MLRLMLRGGSVCCGSCRWVGVYVAAHVAGWECMFAGLDLYYADPATAPRKQQGRI